MTPQKLHRNSVQEQRIAIGIHLVLLVMLVLLAIPQQFWEQTTITGKASEIGVGAIVRILGSNAPTFDQNLTNITINQSDQLFVDVNCSDVDFEDNITYLDNITFFQIDNVTGIINVSGFNDSYIGNHTVQIICLDLFGLAANQSFNLEILNEQSPPVLDPIGNQLLVEGEEFTLDLDASDPEGDLLIFAENTTLFIINSSSGFINFTPAFADIGNHSINFTVFDGLFYDHEVVIFTIVRGPFCGDSLCSVSNDETCETCSQDCGVCPELPGTGGGTPEGGGGGGSGGIPQTSASGGGSTVIVASSQPPPRCDENWECTPWTICSLDGFQTRACKDISGCGTTEKKPEETQECEYEPTCYDGIRNGGEIGIDCGGPCEACEIATCFDGIQNQGEQGIDCGGPCIACAEKALETVPTLQLPAIFDIPRKFPWLLPLIIFILLLLMLLGDYWYMQHLKKHELSVYKQKLRQYNPWRRRLYRAMYNLLAITFVTTIYLWYYSNDPDAMKSNLWKLIVVIMAIPATVSYFIRKYRFYQHEKEKKELHFKQTHRQGILKLLRVENTFLHDLELFTKKDVFIHSKNKDYAQYPVLYQVFSTAYSAITKIAQKRKERLAHLRMDSYFVKQMQGLLENEVLRRYAKNYAEFDAVLRVIQSLIEHKDEDSTDREQDFMNEMEGLTQPHLKSVILEDKQLIKAYNALVDMYEIIKSRSDKLKGLDSSLFDLERSFNDQVKSLTKKSKEIEKVAKNHVLATTYNNFIRLFNHYSKKQQLKKALER